MKQSKTGITAFIIVMIATFLIASYAVSDLFFPACEGKGCDTGSEEGEGLVNFVIYYGLVFISSAISLALGLINLCQKEAKKSYGISAIIISSLYLFFGAILIYGTLGTILPFN